MDINNVVLVGRMTRDAETKYTPSGKSVTSFSLAVDRSYTAGGEKREQVSFLNCIAWEKLGETIAQYCLKGHRVGITGYLQQRTWEDKNGGGKRSTVEIVVHSMQMLQPKPAANGSQAPPPPAEEHGELPNYDGDIPF